MHQVSIAVQELTTNQLSLLHLEEQCILFSRRISYYSHVHVGLNKHVTPCLSKTRVWDKYAFELNGQGGLCVLLPIQPRRTINLVNYHNYRKWSLGWLVWIRSSLAKPFPLLRLVKTLEQTAHLNCRNLCVKQSGHTSNDTNCPLHEKIII